MWLCFMLEDEKISCTQKVKTTNIESAEVHNFINLRTSENQNDISALILSIQLYYRTTDSVFYSLCYQLSQH